LYHNCKIFLHKRKKYLSLQAASEGGFKEFGFEKNFSKKKLKKNLVDKKKSVSLRSQTGRAVKAGL